MHIALMASERLFLNREPGFPSSPVAQVERLENLLQEIGLAEAVALDVFGVGEHHRSEFVDSAPTVFLAAAAARTENIRLTSALPF